MILGRDRHVHAACFDEINAAVEAMTNRVVCFNAHAFDAPADAVIFNTENIPAQVNPERWRGHAVWDFHLPNVAHYPIWMPVKHVPIGHHASMERFERAEELDIDVVFAGAMNERRMAVLDALIERGLNVVVVPPETYGVERDKLLARAKLALNMQFYPDGAWPALRVAHLVANRVPVLSEGHQDAWRFVHAVPYRMLVDRAEWYVREVDDLNRDVVAAEALDRFRAMPMELPS